MKALIKTVKDFQEGAALLKSSQHLDYSFMNKLEEAEIDIINLEENLTNYKGLKYSPYVKSITILGLGKFRAVLYEISYPTHIKWEVKKQVIGYLKKVNLTFLAIKNEDY
jgi:hypothetical protein